MKHIQPQDDWPESWKLSYAYDRQEIYGEVFNRGYVYAYENRRHETLRLLTEVLPPGARILDVAAAQGNFSLTLAEMGYDVTWNDLREELINYVWQKYERGQLQFAPGSLFDLQFPNFFDAVLITEVVEHVAHPDEVLTKAAALVKPGGYIVMTTPNGAYFKNSLPRFSDCADSRVYETTQFKPDANGHIFLLHPDEIGTLAGRAGLYVDERKLFTNPLTSGHVKTERLLQLWPKRWIDMFERATQLLPPSLAEKTLVQMAVRFRKPATSNPQM
jgi:2-polyprenyl-3-methyl-5-hydroxy-6-metoxy-1,4-benzoquinol methylase